MRKSDLLGKIKFFPSSSHTRTTLTKETLTKETLTKETLTKETLTKETLTKEIVKWEQQGFCIRLETSP